MGELDWLGGGVDLFFVISGFVMVRSTSGRGFTPRQFLTHRFQSIVPLYWIATFATMMSLRGERRAEGDIFCARVDCRVQPALYSGETGNALFREPTNTAQRSGLRHDCTYCNRVSSTAFSVLIRHHSNAAFDTEKASANNCAPSSRGSTAISTTTNA